MGREGRTVTYNQKHERTRIPSIQSLQPRRVRLSPCNNDDDQINEHSAYEDCNVYCNKTSV